MIRRLPRSAPLAAAAAASAAGGVAQAGEAVKRGGEPGKLGTATVYWTLYCRTSWAPQDNASHLQDNASQVLLCMTTPGRPGAPGRAVEY